MVSTGINGFGRFGLHLLKYWLDHRKSANFSIDFINDDFLSRQAAYGIILNDRFVRITENHTVKMDGESISFCDKDGFKQSIVFSNREKEQIPWRGEPDFMLECSGKYCRAELNREYLEGETKKIIISAIAADADQTLIVGFNHQDYRQKAQVYSYGSCIINAFVPLTDWVHHEYQLRDCDTAIIHNMPEHQLLKPGNDTLQRRSCSLEWMGPNLLNYLNKDNFTVQKTYIPHPGISMIDMRYRLTSPPDMATLQKDLHTAFTTGSLQTLYSFEKADQSPEDHLNSTFSAILRQGGMRFAGDNLYISCYFDNENSVNRYYDLINYIADHHQAII
jgi:glyceraldehyde 3-phosphate dehydrogenase